MAGQPSNSKSSLSYRIFVTNDLQAADYNLSIPGVPTSLDLSSPCTTWEEVRHLLLWQVPATHLPSWEVLWRWDQLKASVTSGQADPTTLNQRVMGFCRRVEGTREAHQCLVPEQEGRRGVLCEKVINRLDRMRSHIRSDHLAAPGFPCEGQCGNNDW